MAGEAEDDNDGQPARRLPGRRGRDDIRHKSPVDDWKGNWEPGADPERRDDASFADFADPDGNTWMLQEICDCPGTHRLISTAEEAHDVAGDGLPQRRCCPG